MPATKVDHDAARRWYQLCASTWFVFAVAVIVLITLNLPFRYCDAMNPAAISMASGEANGNETIRGGWPLRYLVVHTSEHMDFPVRFWSTLALAGDVLLGILALAFIVRAFEKRRRRQTRLWQLTLSDLCLLMFLTCAVFGSWQMMAHRYLTQHAAEFQLGIEGGRVRWQMQLPKIIVGPDEPTPWRGRLHGWLIEQLWNHERPTTVYLSKLNAESTAAVLRLREIETLIVEDSSVTDEAVAALVSLRNLERLQIDSEKLTDACVPTLQRFRRLRFLRVRNSRLSDDAIAKLAELPKLVSLDVEGTLLTDRGLAAIATHRELRELNIARTLVTELGLPALNGHPKLTSLCLTSWAMKPERPAVRRVKLSGLPLLETLHLPSKIDSLELSNLPSLVQLPSDWGSTEDVQLLARKWGYARGFRQVPPPSSDFPQPMQFKINAKRLSLRDMPRLTTLNLDCRRIESLELEVTSLQSLWMTSISARDVRRLIKEAGLKLDARYKITDEVCAMICRNKSLQTLGLCEASLTTAGWSELASLRKLRSLDLAGSNVTDEDLGAFSQATQLENLTLADTEISNAGYCKLPRLPLLQTLDISDTKITQLELEELSTFESLNVDNTPLESLRLKNLPRFVGAGGSFTVESCGPVTLEAVDLPTLENLALQHLCVEQMVLHKLPRLRNLNLTGSSIDDSMLSDLAQLKSLQQLTLRNTDITDATLSQLSALQQLQSLDLENTAVTDHGLAAIGPQLPRIELNLTGTFVSDDERRRLNSVRY